MPSKIVIQNAENASLKIGEEEVKIGKGLVVYICFLKDAVEDEIPKISKAILNTKLFNISEVEKGSVKEGNGNVLLIPQASLGAKLKNNRPQYHGLIDVEVGRNLYQLLIDHLKGEIGDRLQHGIYGNLQSLVIDSSCGPFSHSFDIS